MNIIGSEKKMIDESHPNIKHPHSMVPMECGNSPTKNPGFSGGV
jgi:hypothetical protein